MNDDQFMKLFSYIEDFRRDVNERFDQTATKDSLEKLVNAMDRFLSRIEDNETEQAARDAQFDRLLEWARA